MRVRQQPERAVQRLPHRALAEDSTWVHGLRFAQLTCNAELKEALVRRYDRFLEPGGTKLMSLQRHLASVD